MENVVETMETIEQTEIMEVIETKEEPQMCTYTGQCKWFNDKYGYGFVTVCMGPEKGKDIFVHYTGVNPNNSRYKTLRKGEYIEFNIVEGKNGPQASDIQGIGGGPLMCDFVGSKSPFSPPVFYNRQSTEQHYPHAPPPPPRTTSSGAYWQSVGRKKYTPMNKRSDNVEKNVKASV
jgi:CspA family cold shock protein